MLWGLLAVVVSVPLGPAPPAAAHAALVATTPTRDQVLASPPRSVQVTFSEPVTPVPGKVQVLAPDGKRISTGEPTVRGTTLTIPVRVADHPLGTYLVSYRVVSADSHPVAGGFTFSAGAPSAQPPQAAGDTVDPRLTALSAVARAVGYLGLVLVVGTVLLLVALWPPRLSRRGPTALAWVGMGLLVVATLATGHLQAAASTGTTVTGVSAGDLATVAGSPLGQVLAARLGLLAAVAALLPVAVRGAAGRRTRWLLALLGVATLVTWPLAGHPVAAPVPPASVLADTMHLASVSVWLGGLVVLVVFVLRRTHERVLAVLLPVWSRWAAAAVCWLVASGLVQVVAEVGRPAALLGTGYGRLVLTKVGLLAVVLAVAAFQRRMVRRGTAAARPRRVARAAAAELALTAVVLAVSAVLVQTTPGRTAGTEAARVDRDSFAQTLTSPLYTLQFDIYPVQLGENNTVHAYLYSADGRQLPAAEWKVTVALPDKGVEPVGFPMAPLEANHAIGALTFPTPGDWRVSFTIRTSEVDQATVTTVVPVR